MKKIFVVGSALNYADFINDSILTSDMSEADIVLFTGGSDVSPALYKTRPHRSTMCDKERDKAEYSKKSSLTSLLLAFAVG